MMVTTLVKTVMAALPYRCTGSASWSGSTKTASIHRQAENDNLAAGKEEKNQRHRPRIADMSDDIEFLVGAAGVMAT